MDASRRRLPRCKRWIYSAVALVFCFLTIEITARCVHFQVAGRSSLAVVEGWDWLRDRVERSKLQTALQSSADLRATYREARSMLSSDAEGAMRETLQAAYAEYFAQLLRATRNVGSELIVIDFLEGRGRPFGDFIAELAARLGVRHLDLAASVRAIERDHRVLAPADGHLTRHANLVVADGITTALVTLAEHRNGRDYRGTPAILGDAFDRYVGEGPSQLLELKPQLGFVLLRNAQGLRGAEDVEVPKLRQRVLCLGDSYTFGDHLNDQDTWPDAIRRAAGHLEVLNGGISGYTIADQVALFVDRAQHCAPDITLLQVCENDLVELLGRFRAVMGRPGGASRVLDGEEAFLERVRARLTAPDDPRAGRPR